MEAEQSRMDLVEETGLGRETVSVYLRSLKRLKLIHTSDWRRDVMGKWTIEVFEWGDGKDVKRPKPQSIAESMRRYRAKKKHLKTIQLLAG